MQVTSSLFADLVLCLTFLVAQVKAINVIDSNSVVPLAQSVPPGGLGQLYLRYKPYLYIANGCVPFPAVNAVGDVSGGLKPTGDTNGGCSSSSGQIYARSSVFGDRFAIMYAWFMPKDEPSPGIGHRYDWEEIVVWLDSTRTKLLGVAASAHGQFNTQTQPALLGSAPLIEYISYYPLDHSLAFTSTVGGMQPLITWETMGPAVTASLSGFDWGSANVPFIDTNFNYNLGLATLK